MTNHFPPTEKGIAINDYNEMLDMFHNFEAKQIILNGNINYSYTPINMSMNLDLVKEINVNNLLFDIKEFQQKYEIIPAIGRYVVQLKLPNIIEKDEASDIFLPIMIGCILEKTVLTDENKALFFINTNIINPRLAGRIKLIS